jgi:hypothetical protein
MALLVWCLLLWLPLLLDLLLTAWVERRNRWLGHTVGVLALAAIPVVGLMASRGESAAAFGMIPTLRGWSLLLLALWMAWAFVGTILVAFRRSSAVWKQHVLALALTPMLLGLLALTLRPG